MKRLFAKTFLACAQWKEKCRTHTQATEWIDETIQNALAGGVVWMAVSSSSVEIWVVRSNPAWSCDEISFLMPSKIDINGSFWATRVLHMFALTLVVKKLTQNLFSVKHGRPCHLKNVDLISQTAHHFLRRYVGMFCKKYTFCLISRSRCRYLFAKICNNCITWLLK
jgi:hypothetical protein